MMTGQEFFELYKEQQVKVDTRYHYWHSDSILRVINYTGLNVAVKTTNGIPSWAGNDTFWFPSSSLIPLYPRVSDEETIQDDCLECGAVGNEVCKNGCRNKQ